MTLAAGLWIAMSFRVIRPLLFYAGVVLVWQLLSLAEVWPSYLFPSPAAVFDSLAQNVQNGVVIQAILLSLNRMAIGYISSFILGAFLGLLTGTIQWMDDTLGTAVLGLQSLPSITWLPLAILWIGLNQQAIIFVVLMGSLFSIAISTRAGVRGIPPILQQAAQTFGATRWQMYRYVVLPGMLPSIVQGLKLGWSFAWRSLMAGELLFVSPGLGQVLNRGRDLNDMSLVIAIMLVIMAIGLTFDRLLFGRLEARVQERWGLATSAL